MYALAGDPVAGTYPNSYPYADTGDLFDVTAGANGGCGNVLCEAGPGWDGPTGSRHAERRLRAVHRPARDGGRAP